MNAREFAEGARSYDFDDRMLLQCVLSVAKGVRVNALSVKHTDATAVGIQVAAFRYRQTQIVPKSGPKTKTRRLGEPNLRTRGNLHGVR